MSRGLGDVYKRQTYDRYILKVSLLRQLRRQIPSHFPTAVYVWAAAAPVVTRVPGDAPEDAESISSGSRSALPLMDTLFAGIPGSGWIS